MKLLKLTPVLFLVLFLQSVSAHAQSCTDKCRDRCPDIVGDIPGQDNPTFRVTFECNYDRHASYRGWWRDYPVRLALQPNEIYLQGYILGDFFEEEMTGISVAPLEVTRINERELDVFKEVYLKFGTVAGRADIRTFGRIRCGHQTKVDMVGCFADVYINGEYAEDINREKEFFKLNRLFPYDGVGCQDDEEEGDDEGDAGEEGDQES
jgi:hypothetical protein